MLSLALSVLFWQFWLTYQNNDSILRKKAPPLLQAHVPVPVSSAEVGARWRRRPSFPT